MNVEEQLKVLKSSRHFHSKWYRETHPDVGDQSVVEHYFNEGVRRGLNPGKFFDTKLYLSRYPDVAVSGLNPLVHYELIGEAEGRAINESRAKAQDRKMRQSGADMTKAAEPEKMLFTGGSATFPKPRKSPKKEAKKAKVKAISPTASINDTVEGLSKKARTAAKSKDWVTAAAYWQDILSLPAEPYVGLAEATAELGDLDRAESIVEDALVRFPGNPRLLVQHCALALKSASGLQVPSRWLRIEESGCVVSNDFKASVAEVFLKQGDLEKAGALLDEVREAIPDSSLVLRLGGTLAEAQHDWEVAAEIWMLRGRKAQGIAKRNSYVRGVQAMIQLGDLERAEAAAQDLATRFPKEAAYLKLLAEVAIRQEAWTIGLMRWQDVEALDPNEVGAMPSEWIYRMGLEEATKQTRAIKMPHLRATGMMAIARTLENVDEPAALLMARQARRFYGEKVAAMVARILSTNTRHSAAIWWLRRLVGSSASPKAYYARLMESLLEASRTEECCALLDSYVLTYGHDTLWLRVMMEVHYRAGDFVAMRDVMEAGANANLPGNVKTVRVLRWLYELIRLHPNPQDFLPNEIHSLVLQVAELYDNRFMKDSLAVLLDPAKGDALAESYAGQLADAVAGTRAIEIAQREEILQFFLRRREWDHVHAVLNLPLDDQLSSQNVRKYWNIVRNKLDILLGEADVAGAETVACDFLDRLAESDLDGFALSQVTGLLFRLPISAPLAERLLGAAQRADFEQLAQRIQDWRDRHTGFDAAPLVGSAKRDRCFIVGNAPSIADLPLELLEGEDIFSVNRGMRALDVGLPQPKYLVVADPLVYKNHAAEIDADGASVEKFFVASNCLWRKPPTIPAVPMGSSGLKLSLAPFKHAPLHLHRGETVVVMAAQLAHSMGYKEIYIIGVDLDYSGASTHFYVAENGGKKEIERLANFRPGGSGTEMVNLAFENLQVAVEKDGCRLYNAAPAGKLDRLERVSFTSLFDEQPAREKVTQ